MADSGLGTISHATPICEMEMLIVAIANRLSEQEYRELGLSESDRLWELWDGALVGKPLMSMKHEDASFYLGHMLANQLDRSVYHVSVNAVRTRLFPCGYY